MFSECDMFFSEYRYVFGMRICFFRNTDMFPESTYVFLGIQICFRNAYMFF